MFKKKYEKYTKILNRLTWLNACSSGISIATGISGVATFATFIGIPVSAALAAASMTGVITSGIISVLIKKYQQKFKKITKLIHIITQALVIFERVVSSSLKDGADPEVTPLHGINEEEFNMLQALKDTKDDSCSLTLLPMGGRIFIPHHHIISCHSETT